MAAHDPVERVLSIRGMRILVKRHKLKGRGTRQFSNATVFGELGVLSLGTPSA